MKKIFLIFFVCFLFSGCKEEVTNPPPQTITLEEFYKMYYPLLGAWQNENPVLDGYNETYIFLISNTGDFSYSFSSTQGGMHNYSGNLLIRPFSSPPYLIMYNFNNEDLFLNWIYDENTEKLSLIKSSFVKRYNKIIP
jgi:hypothetical protein